VNFRVMITENLGHLKNRTRFGIRGRVLLKRGDPAFWFCASESLKTNLTTPRGYAPSRDGGATEDAF
jgi:hypothetical protein